MINYDWAGPPEYEETDLPWVECDKCFWDGSVVGHFVGKTLCWICPSCDYYFRGESHLHLRQDA